MVAGSFHMNYSRATVAESPLLEKIKEELDRAFIAKLSDIEGLFQPKQFCDSTTFRFDPMSHLISAKLMFSKPIQPS